MSFFKKIRKGVSRSFKKVRSTVKRVAKNPLVQTAAIVGAGAFIPGVSNAFSGFFGGAPAQQQVVEQQVVPRAPPTQFQPNFRPNMQPQFNRFAAVGSGIGAGGASCGNMGSDLITFPEFMLTAGCLYLVTWLGVKAWHKLKRFRLAV